MADKGKVRRKIAIGALSKCRRKERPKENEKKAKLDDMKSQEKMKAQKGEEKRKENKNTGRKERGG